MAFRGLELLALLWLPASSSPVENIVAVWSKSKIGLVPDTSEYASTGKIVRAMSHLPAPQLQAQASAMDPRPSGLATCDRDYGMLCPDNFVNIGPVKGGDKLYCTASDDYSGPCTGAYAFQGLSASAKAMWSETCLTKWPCKTCSPDCSKPCPQGWEHKGEGKCSPPPDYTGKCDMEFEFGGYNALMRDAWSQTCGAFWSCLTDGAEALAKHSMFAGRKQPQVSFLTSRSIPVDAYKVRNSLELTQPLREPEQATVNVLVHEDIGSMQEESKYRGMEDQTLQLKEQIKTMLAAMSSS